MRTLCLLCALSVTLGCLVSAAGAGTRGLPDYWQESRLLVDVPGASSSALAGVFNPAAWGLRRSGLALAWEDRAAGGEAIAGTAARATADWLAVASLRRLAFGMRGYHREMPDGKEWRGHAYTLGTAFGDRGLGFGLAYTWHDRRAREGGRHRRLSFGAIRRWRPLSLGLASIWDLERDDHDVQLDLGLRPFGPRVTLFAEALYTKGIDFGEIHAGYGCEVHPLRGVALGVRALDTGEFSLRIGLSPGRGEQLGAGAHFDRDAERRSTSYAVEWNTPGPGLAFLRAGERYAEINLRGPLVYRRYRWFDDRQRLIDVLARLDRIAVDPAFAGVVLNLSGMTAGGELLWELRQQLAGVRAAGKKVIVYFDGLGMSGYLLASVADQIWIDPVGDLNLRGLSAGRTYYGDLLGKIGLGVDEWRLNTHKSYFETLARSDMSPPEREQLQEVIDDIYEEILSAATAARGLTRGAWEEILEEQLGLLPREALAAGLVDSIGTWQEARRAAPEAPRRTTGDATRARLGGLLGDSVWEPLAWGERPRIALLHAVGECAMESGIEGRRLAAAVRAAGEDPSVRAIVLRVDSPGGEALPSDLVARELKAAGEVKPVLVSQGAVAASGGYWLSMYADTIVASPVTVTGSIGVAAGWIWDQELGERLGLSYDHVQRGSHADLGRGIRVPVLGVTVPARPLTARERTRAMDAMRQLYDEFVGMVAEGRGLEAAEVDRVGQGRIWMGRRARGHGLVDELGGLWTSLRIAKEAAGIPVARAVAIGHGPSLGLLRLPKLLPDWGLLRSLGLRRAVNDAPCAAADLPVNPAGGGTCLEIEALAHLSPLDRLYLRQIIAAQGRPVLMMEPLWIEDSSPR